MLRTIRNLLLTILAAVLPMSATDPSLGTWKLNTAKSKFSGPADKSATVTLSQDGDWIVQKADWVDAEGKATTSTVRFKRDGKEYPLQERTGPGKITFKRTDDYHFQWVFKGEDKSLKNGRTVISKDGKTRTLTTTGVNAKGEKVKSVMVFDRQ